MSTPNRISTTGSIILATETFETNNSSGPSATRVFTGTKALCLMQRNTELALGASMTKLESTGDGNYKLTAGYSKDPGGNDAEQPINAHELENTMEQVDIYNSDVMRGQLITVLGSWSASTAAIAYLKGKVDQCEAMTKKDGAALTSLEAGFSAIYSGTGLALMLNLFRGIAYHQIKHAPQFNSVYRRRITAASYNQIQAAFTGVGKIWTTAEILAFEAVPGSWWFQLPTDKVWLKAAPTVNTVAGQKTEIVYNYIASAYAWSGNQTAYSTATLITF